MTPEQKTIIQSFGQGQAVLAGAGCGKTTTLVWKIEALLAANPSRKYAAVSFTERSTADLRAKLSPVGTSWVKTIHGLSGAVLREFPEESGTDGEEAVLSVSESASLWKRAVESVWFDALSEGLTKALERLLERESRYSIEELLLRAKDLASFGFFERPLTTDLDTQALAVLSRFVCDRYSALKRRRGAIDFDDLEQGALRALSHEHVRARFHKRFDLLLVDEFQDTNPVQARVIEALSRPGFTNLCVVGDPKQSIYRFRDADVGIFQTFCERLPLRQPLSVNFRSRPSLIEYTNAVCEPVFRSIGTPYEPLSAGREAATPEEQEIIRLNLDASASDGEAAGRLLGLWLRGRSFQGDSALLLRRIRGNEKWLKGLMAAGVELAVESGGFFWEDPRVRELVALLKWWDNPANAFSGAVFLRAPWVGVSDQEIDAWVKEDPTFRLPFWASNHALAQALAPLASTATRPGEILMALLRSEPEPALMIERELGASLLGLWHRCETLSERGFDFHRVVSELSSALEDKRRDRGVPPPRVPGRLTVLSVHGAKGLEFDEVILTDFGPPRRNSPAPLLFWDRKEGAFLGKRLEDGERDRKDPEEKRWRERELEQSRADSQRLFYVALTRAKERLVLVCPKIDVVFEEDPLKLDFWRGWIDSKLFNKMVSVDSVFNGDPKPAPVPSQARSDKLARPIRAIPGLSRARHSVSEWIRYESCPRRYEWTDIRPLSWASLVPLVKEGSGGVSLSAREIGTRVHACLEKADLEGLRELELESGGSFRAEPLIEWAERSPWMRLEAHDRAWVELEFEIPLGRDEALVGAMDRVIARSDGSFHVLDFKISRVDHGPQELITRYQRQMELYAWALARIEPSAIGRVSARLIGIGPEDVREVEVPLAPWVQEGETQAIEGRLEGVRRIIDGASGKPRPGLGCRSCEVRERCPEQLKGM